MQEFLPETADVVTSSESYAGRFSGPVGRWFLSVQERIALATLDKPAGKTALDVGGGHGQLTKPMINTGLKVTVLGSDDSCSRRIDALIKDGQCEFRVGNVVALPFPDKSFDFAFSFRLLPHCTQWQKLIAELCRVARLGVIVDYPVSQGMNAAAPLFFGAKKKLEGNTREWRQFTHREVSHEFSRNGFKVEVRRGQFFLPMALHRGLKLKPVSAALEGFFRALGLTARFGSPVILKAVPSLQPAS